MAHGQFAVYQNPEVLSHRAASQPGSLQFVILPGILPFYVQDFTSVPAELCKTHTSSLSKSLRRATLSLVLLTGHRITEDPELEGTH